MRPIERVSAPAATFQLKRFCSRNPTGDRIFRSTAARLGRVAVVVSATLSCACGGEAEPASTGAPPGELDAPAWMTVAFPMIDCADLPPTPAQIVLDPTFNFENALTERGVTGLTDVAVGPDSTLFLLDARGYAVVVLDARGKELRRWGREGDGPGEFREPVSIDLDGESIYVVERSGMLHIFALDGRFIRSKRLPLNPDFVAVLGSGQMVVTNQVTNAPRYRGDPSKDRLYVSRTDTAGNVVPVARAATEDFGKRPFISPLWDQPHATAGPNERFAVWFEIDNSVDVYQDTSLVAQIRGCMPAEVLESYRKQREQYGGRGSGSRRMIGGAFLDADGSLLVANPRPIADSGRITRYDASGRVQAVYEFPIDGYDFQNAEWIDSRGIVTWRSDGRVRRWVVR